MTKKEIGEYIRKVQEKKGLTNNRLCLDMFFVSKRQVRSWQLDGLKDGSKQYRIDLLLDAAEALGLEVVLREKTKKKEKE